MWEVRAHPDGFADLLAWVCDWVVPNAEHSPGHITSEVFSSTDHRILVISRWRNEPVTFETPPRHLVAREPNVWDFAPVDR